MLGDSRYWRPIFPGEDEEYDKEKAERDRPVLDAKIGGHSLQEEEKGQPWDHGEQPKFEPQYLPVPVFKLLSKAFRAKVVFAVGHKLEECVRNIAMDLAMPRDAVRARKYELEEPSDDEGDDEEFRRWEELESLSEQV